MDLNEYHRLWNLGCPESECVRGAEEAYEELQWENRRRAAYESEMEAEYYEEMEQQRREAMEAADRTEEERNR